jgi:hypothetical protein
MLYLSETCSRITFEINLCVHKLIKNNMIMEPKYLDYKVIILMSVHLKTMKLAKPLLLETNVQSVM